MALNITYGQGGYCENCNDTHEHPLYNIINQYEVEDSQPTEQEMLKQSAVTKFRKLGLTDEIGRAHV